jgi:hypothetical protein
MNVILLNVIVIIIVRFIAPPPPIERIEYHSYCPSLHAIQDAKYLSKRDTPGFR